MVFMPSDHLADIEVFVPRALPRSAELSADGRERYWPG